MNHCSQKNNPQLENLELLLQFFKIILSCIDCVPFRRTHMLDFKYFPTGRTQKIAFCKNGINFKLFDDTERCPVIYQTEFELIFDTQFDN